MLMTFVVFALYGVFAASVRTQTAFASLKSFFGVRAAAPWIAAP